MAAGLGGAAMLFRRFVEDAPEVVSHVDLTRYAGTWYELARYPMRSERDCFGVQAHYHLRDNGTLDVVNECRKGGFDGPVKRVHGNARVVDPATNARLKVRFFGLFGGDYWILDLGRNYEYAVVGDRKRRHLWILSRTPQLPRDVMERILNRAQEKGYTLGRLLMTPQAG